MSEPTARQREVYEAAKAAGSFSGAGLRLGIKVGAVASGVKAYMTKTGEPHPTTPRTEQRRWGTPEDFKALETRQAATETALNALTNVSAELAEAIRDFLHRQPIILAPARPDASHRRIADGGVGGRREMRDRDRD